MHAPSSYAAAAKRSLAAAEKTDHATARLQVMAAQVAATLALAAAIEQLAESGAVVVSEFLRRDLDN